jgi:hypothetical protein
MDIADNAVIALFILGAALLLAWLFRAVALAFGRIVAINAHGRRNVSEDKQEMTAP